MEGDDRPGTHDEILPRHQIRLDLRTRCHVSQRDGVIEEFDPPRRLVMTWHVLYDAEMEKEQPSRVEWDLAPASAERTVTRLTLRHRDLGMSPLTWANVRLGWVGVLDGMKTLIETGEPLGDVTFADESPSDADGEMAPRAGREGEQLGVGSTWSRRSHGN